MEQILQVIKQPTDAAAQREAEQRFVELRSLRPSDQFVTAITEIIISNQQLRDTAAVLLLNDIKKNGTESSVAESDQDVCRKQMTKLLCFVAQDPQKFVIDLVGRYFADDIQWPEAPQFIAQAMNEPNSKVRLAAMTVLREACEGSLERLQTIGIDTMGILGAGLQDEPKIA